MVSLLLGDFNMEFLFEFKDGAPAMDKEHAYLIWVSDFSSMAQGHSRCRRPPLACLRSSWFHRIGHHLFQRRAPPS